MTGALAAFDAVTERVMLPLTVLGLVVGVGATVAGNDELAWWCWTVPAVLVGVWLVVSILRDLLKGQAGVDVIAVMAIGGALLLDESLTASVIAVMLATGHWLERYAEGRAHRELSALVSRAPRIVHRHEDGSIADRGIDGRHGRRPPARQARRGRAGRRQRDGRFGDPRRVRPDRRGPPRVSRGG